MNLPTRRSWAGLAAILGGSIAILLTIPFASAYFMAYSSPSAAPFWIHSLQSVLTPFLTFSAPTHVYNIYGRIFNVVYFLFLPAVFALHDLLRDVSGTLEKSAFGILTISLLVTSVGVAGDYWWNGTGFLLEVLGLLALNIGTSLYGVIILQYGVLPKWCGWLMASCFPGLFVFVFLIGHIPSAPTVLVAVSWLTLGFILFSQKGLHLQERAVGGSYKNQGV